MLQIIQGTRLLFSKPFMHDKLSLENYWVHHIWKSYFLLRNFFFFVTTFIHTLRQFKAVLTALPIIGNITYHKADNIYTNVKQWWYLVIAKLWSSTDTITKKQTTFTQSKHWKNYTLPHFKAALTIVCLTLYLSHLRKRDRDNKSCQN